jgi:hypothetical protein
VKKIRPLAPDELKRRQPVREHHCLELREVVVERRKTRLGGGGDDQMPVPRIDARRRYGRIEIALAPAECP